MSEENGIHRSARPGRALVLGASRGLGLAMVRTLLDRGWTVTATERRPSALRDLAMQAAGRLRVETADLTDPAGLGRLGERLSAADGEGSLDLLFVNGGTNCTQDPSETVAAVSTEDFHRVMDTNALGPMRAVETLQRLVAADGTIGVMSSGQGSVANNVRGGFEVYRASKSALNQLMRSYAARHAGEERSLVLLAPGWIRTGIGGDGAFTTVEEAIPEVVTTLLGQAGRPGLHYVDRQGNPISW